MTDVGAVHADDVKVPSPDDLPAAPLMPTEPPLDDPEMDPEEDATAPVTADPIV